MNTFEVSLFKNQERIRQSTIEVPDFVNDEYGERFALINIILELSKEYPELIEDIAQSLCKLKKGTPTE